MAGPSLGERGWSAERLLSSTWHVVAPCRRQRTQRPLRPLALRLLASAVSHSIDMPQAAHAAGCAPMMPCAGVPMTGVAAAVAAATTTNAPAALQSARGVGQAVSQARQAPAQALLQVHPCGPAPWLSTQWRLRAKRPQSDCSHPREGMSGRHVWKTLLAVESVDTREDRAHSGHVVTLGGWRPGGGVHGGLVWDAVHASATPIRRC